MHHSSRRFLCVAFILVTAQSASARSLYWRSIDTVANLEADGTLDVTERQTMVFDGDYNGGYRAFNLRGDQSVELIGIERESPSGNVTLRAGDLDGVDEYRFVDPTMLRWRSRRLSDPAFSHQDMVYVLHYRLQNVLSGAGDRYRLDHDFLFADRKGDIEHFSLRLTFDPAWRDDSGAPLDPIAKEARDIPPGRSFVMKLDLTHQGATSVRAGVPKWVTTLLSLLPFIALLLLYSRFRAREAQLGRIALIANDVNITFVERQLLSMPAEEVGALYNATIGNLELMATLARMVVEGKLSSSFHAIDKEAIVKVMKANFETAEYAQFRIAHPTAAKWIENMVVGQSALAAMLPKPNELHFRLRVPRESLDGYERKLVDSFFPLGIEETNAALIRVLHPGGTFDPATPIKQALKARIEARFPADENTLPPRAQRSSWAIVIAGCALLALAQFRHNPSQIAAVPALCAMWIMFLYLMPALASFGLVRDTAIVSHRSLLLFAIPIVPAVFYIYQMQPSTLSCLGADLFAIGLARSLICLAMSRDSREKIAVKRAIAAARRYFERELAKPQPQLKDEWTPYLIALGLMPRVGRWVSRFSSASAAVSSLGGSSSLGSSFGGASSGANFTGGGGQFGGAGASGSWGGGFAASSSSSSSSGGSSSGSSSGGGGGGGW